MLLALALLVVPAQCAEFPRIANLWGCSPSSTEYDEWARYDLLVLAGGSPASYRAFVPGSWGRRTRVLLGSRPPSRDPCVPIWPAL